MARGGAETVYHYWKRGKVRKATKETPYIWSLAPEEQGGLVVDTQDELERALMRALAETDCCSVLGKRFVAKHCAPYDGRNCERIADVVRGLGEHARSAPPRKRFLSSLFGR